jgi:hypothetical protein
MTVLDLLLAEKYRVQKELALEAGDDIEVYLEHIHQLALEIQERSGWKFNYGVPLVPPAK